MPIRIEKWSVADKIKYRVVGIAWGGSQPVKALTIRFNPEEDYVPVDHFNQAKNDPWTLWTHASSPSSPGTYMIRLAVKEPAVQARRLDSGYYVRTVEITEVWKRTDASRVKEQQLLAMANIARMLNLGGIFLANNVLPAQHTNDLEYPGRRTTAYTPTGAYGDDVVVYRRRWSPGASNRFYKSCNTSMPLGHFISGRMTAYICVLTYGRRNQHSAK